MQGQAKINQVGKWGLLSWLLVFYSITIGLFFDYGRTLLITVIPFLIILVLLAYSSLAVSYVSLYLLLICQILLAFIVSIFLPMAGRLLILNALIPVLLFEEISLNRKWKTPVISTFYIIVLVIYYILSIKLTWTNLLVLLEAIVSVGIATGIIYRSIYWQLMYTKRLYEMNKRLDLANQQIKRLTAQQVKREVARDLHDTLAQDLIGINMQLTVISQVAKNNQNYQTQEMLNNTQQMLNQAIHKSRMLIKEYRQEDRQEQSLKLGVLSVIDRFRREYNLTIDLSLQTDAQLPVGQLTDIQQVLNEALMNVVKHGESRRAQVNINRQVGQLRIVVENQGKVTGKKVQDHFGLVNMKERVAKYNGRLTLKGINDNQVVLIASFNVLEEK